MTGCDAGVLPEIADLFDAIIGGSVDFNDVDVFAGGNRLACGANAAGLAVFTLGTIDRLGQNARRGGFAYAACAGKEKRMGQPPGDDGIFKCLGDCFLADQLVEVLRAVAPGEYGISLGHNEPLATTIASFFFTGQLWT